MEMVEAMALVTGCVEEEILSENEYLAAENEILKSKISRFNGSRPELTERNIK